MALSETLDDITGGDVLRLPALQSPNYVAGSTGWIIKGDGTVEFNAGTFRGSVQIGTNPGKHITLANPTTGDAVDVYDSGNNLIFFIDNTGRAVSTVSASGNQAIMSGGFFTLSAQDANLFAYNSQLLLAIDATQQSAITTLSSFDSNSGDEYALELRSAGISGVSGLPMALGTERNIRGSLIQSDQIGVNNMVHVIRRSVTTNGSGDGSFNPGLAFTPGACIAQPTALTFTVQGSQIIIWRDLLTAINVAFRIFSPGGAAFVGTMLVDFAFYG